MYSPSILLHAALQTAQTIEQQQQHLSNHKHIWKVHPSMSAVHIWKGGYTEYNSENNGKFLIKKENSY